MRGNNTAVKHFTAIFSFESHKGFTEYVLTNILIFTNEENGI